MAQSSRRPGSGSRRARAWALRRLRLSRKASARRSDGWLLADGLTGAFGGSCLLDDIGPSGQAARRVIRPRLPGQSLAGAARSMDGAARPSGVHQALKGADILAMAPPALELPPPIPHRDDHGPLSPVESMAGAPVTWCVGYRIAMIEPWPNCGHFMTVTESPDISGPCLGWPKVALSAPFSGGGHPPTRIRRCRSSVVEHVLGKDGVGSSILLGSTTLPIHRMAGEVFAMTPPLRERTLTGVV